MEGGSFLGHRSLGEGVRPAGRWSLPFVDAKHPRGRAGLCLSGPAVRITRTRTPFVSVRAIASAKVSAPPVVALCRLEGRGYAPALPLPFAVRRGCVPTQPTGPQGQRPSPLPRAVWRGGATSPPCRCPLPSGGAAFPRSPLARRARPSASAVAVWRADSSESAGRCRGRSAGRGPRLPTVASAKVGAPPCRCPLPSGGAAFPRSPLARRARPSVSAVCRRRLEGRFVRIGRPWPWPLLCGMEGRGYVPALPLPFAVRRGCVPTQPTGPKGQAVCLCRRRLEGRFVRIGRWWRCGGAVAVRRQEGGSFSGHHSFSEGVRPAGRWPFPVDMRQSLYHTNCRN